MAILSRAQVREVDRRAIEEYGMSGLVLMENAGRGVADWLFRLNRQRNIPVGWQTHLSVRTGGDCLRQGQQRRRWFCHCTTFRFVRHACENTSAREPERIVRRCGC